MTTIVYDHKRGQIACDSRLTSDGTVATDSAEKYINTKKGMVFFAGSIGDFELFADIIENNEHGSCIELDCEIECDSLLVSDGKVFNVFMSDQILNYQLLSFHSGIGCGCNWALSALDHGKTAKQAVEYAATRDIYTGGKVRVYDINKGKFING